MSKLPDWGPGRTPIYWHLRDECGHWPASELILYKAFYDRWGGEPFKVKDVTVAGCIGRTDRFVRKWRAELAKHGVLSWESGKSSHEANTYTLHPPWRWKLTAEEEASRIVVSTATRKRVPSTRNVPTKSEPGSYIVGTVFLPTRNDIPTKSEQDSDRRNPPKEAILKKPSPNGGAVERDIPTSFPSGVDQWGEHLWWYRSELRKLSATMVLLQARSGTQGGQHSAHDRVWEGLKSKENPNPYVELAWEVIAKAPATGRPASWLWSQALIYAGEHPAEFDGTANSLGALLRRGLSAGRIDTGYPEWLSIEDWNDWLLAKGLCVDQEPGREAEFAQDLRWARVLNHYADTDPLYHLMGEAQDTGAQLVDCPDYQCFGLVNVAPDVAKKLVACKTEVWETLANAYRLEGAAAMRIDWTADRRKFRSILHEAMANGDRRTVIAYAVEDPGYSVEVARTRGWMKAYPVMGAVLQVAADTSDLAVG